MSMNWLPGLRARHALPALLVTLVALAGCDEPIRSVTFSTVQVTPQLITFPALQVGESDDRTVLIENIGAGDLKLADLRTDLSDEFNIYWALTTQGDDAQRVAVEDGTNFFDGVVTVPEEEGMVLVVNYVPSGAGSVGGSITLAANDRDMPTITINVQVLQGGPELLLEPPVVDFERIPAGEVGNGVITATNIGQETLIFEQIQLNGSDDFGILIGEEDPADNPLAFADPDGDGQPGLAPGARFQIPVTYRPQSDEADNGEVIFVTNDARMGNQAVTLRGNGASPCVRVTPETLQFGAALLQRDNRQRLTIESCGGEPLRLDDIRITDDGEGVFSIDEDTLPPLPSQLPAVDANAEQPALPSRGFTVVFTPIEEDVSQGELVIVTNDPARTEVTVPLIGRGTRNECPVGRVAQEEFVVLPLDIVTLDASPSSDADGPDGSPVRYEWTVVSRPDGSSAVPVEQFNNPLRPADGGPADAVETPTAQFFVDLTGEYIIELRVVDSLDMAAPSETCPQAPAQVRILAEPDEDIHVQMVWDTPGDDTAPVNPQTDADGSDVDLWFLHPQALSWGDIGRRCYYGNPSPDWGALGQVDDNPSLDIDDVNGAGPENVNLNNPENTMALGGAYRVGAHYYRSFREVGIGDYGPSLVTIRIYLGGALAFESERELPDTDDFWEVAAIAWTPGDRRVQPINRFYELPPN